jgi:hypothetical protein
MMNPRPSTSGEPVTPSLGVAEKAFPAVNDTDVARIGFNLPSLGLGYFQRLGERFAH